MCAGGNIYRWTKSQVIAKITDGATPGRTGLMTLEVDGIRVSLRAYILYFQGDISASRIWHAAKLRGSRLEPWNSRAPV